MIVINKNVKLKFIGDYLIYILMLKFHDTLFELIYFLYI